MTSVSNLVPGSVGSPVALRFNGSNALVNVPSNAVPLGNSPYTIEAWMYPETSGALGIIGWGPYGTAQQVNALRLNGSAVENYWWAADLILSARIAILQMSGITRPLPSTAPLA
jgi:hypothetical protein